MNREAVYEQPKIDEGVDTGDILAQKEIQISESETAKTLYNKVNDAHVELVVDCIEKMKKGTLRGIKQNQLSASYWPGRTPEDGEIKSSMTVDEVDRLVRATTRPYPGAFIREKENSKTIIWSGNKTQPPTESIEIKCCDGIFYGIDIEFSS